MGHIRLMAGAHPGRVSHNPGAPGPSRRPVYRAGACRWSKKSQRFPRESFLEHPGSYSRLWAGTRRFFDPVQRALAPHPGFKSRRSERFLGQLDQMRRCPSGAWLS